MVLILEARWALGPFGMDTHPILEDHVLGTDVFVIQQTPGAVIQSPLWTALHIGFTRGRGTPRGRDNVIEGD